MRVAEGHSSRTFAARTKTDKLIDLFPPLERVAADSLCVNERARVRVHTYVCVHVRMDLLFALNRYGNG